MVDSGMHVEPEQEEQLTNQGEPAPAPPQDPVLGLQERMRHYLHSLRSHHSEALETGDVEAIHKMRVATRRLQAAVDLLQTGSSGARVQALKKRLRKLRRSMAEVRNYDVFIAMVEQDSVGKRPSLQRYQNELVTGELRKHRAKSLLKIKQTLGSAHIGELSDRVREVCGIEKHSSDAGNPHTSGESGVTHPDAEAFRRRIVDRLEQRLAELQHLAARIHAASRPETIHRLRIAAKRLRYLLELASEIGYGDVHRTVEWLKLLQDRLGELHDIDAFQQEVIDIVSRPKFLKKHLLESAGMLYAVARVVGGREALTAKTFPVRVPLSVGAATRRMARAFAKSTAQVVEPLPDETPGEVTDEAPHESLSESAPTAENATIAESHPESPDVEQPSAEQAAGAAE